jgi:flagellar basal-body rod protein FlgG
MGRKTGLDAQNTQMAVIANNLANSNTTGFKADRAAFQDLMYQNVQQVGAQSTQNTQYSTGLSLGTGVRIAATEKNYTRAACCRPAAAWTCRSMAADFFQITHAGRHARLHPRRLVLAGQPGQCGDRERLSAAARDHHSRSPRSRSRSAPTAPSRSRPPGSQQADHGRPGPAGPLHQRAGPAAHRQQSGDRIRRQRRAAGRHRRHQRPRHLQQGTLETSNVNTVTELVNMIECQRAYEMNSKAITTTDQMLQYLTTNLS